MSSFGCVLPRMDGGLLLLGFFPHRSFVTEIRYSELGLSGPTSPSPLFPCCYCFLKHGEVAFQLSRPMSPL